jgi:hypothetical protein
LQKNGTDPFTTETRLLLSHTVIGANVSAIAGYLAALTAGENMHMPVILGIPLLINGLVCGIRVEDIEDPLMQKIRSRDKLRRICERQKMEKI